MDKLKVLFVTSRPISWVNTAYPFVAAYLMLGGGVDLVLIVGGLFFLIPYNLLMYGINDVFDYESDIQNPRKGGVEGAITPKSDHSLIIWASTVLLIPFVAALLALGSLQSAATLMVVLFFVVAYSAKGLRFKEIPFLDSMTSSIHFVGPLVFAYSLLGVSDSKAWLAAGAFFAWGMASHALGAIQDIIPDRKGELSSIATVMGARMTLYFVIAGYLVAAILVSMLGGTAWIVGCVGLLYVLNAVEFIGVTDKTSGSTRRAWKRFLWLNYIAGAVITILLVGSIVSKM